MISCGPRTICTQQCPPHKFPSFPSVLRPVAALRLGSSVQAGGCELRRLFALITVNTQQKITAAACTHQRSLMARFKHTHARTWPALCHMCVTPPSHMSRAEKNQRWYSMCVMFYFLFSPRDSEVLQRVTHPLSVDLSLWLPVSLDQGQQSLITAVTQLSSHYT